MTRRRFGQLVGILGLLALFQWIAIVPASSQTGLVLVPGQALGPVKIGDTAAQVQAAFGEPERKGWTDTEPKYWTWSYETHKCRVPMVTVLLLNEKVVRMFSQNPALRTKEGVGCQSTTADVERALGTPTQRKEGVVGPEFYYASGIRFIFQGDTAIGVEICPPSHK